jgi:hypothetical protein
MYSQEIRNTDKKERERDRKNVNPKADPEIKGGVYVILVPGGSTLAQHRRNPTIV